MSVDLSAIQVEIAARLAADEYFADITVLEEHDKEILPKLKAALGCLTAKAGKTGAYVLVAGAEPDVSNPDGGMIDRAALGVSTIEMPLINKGSTGTGKNALDIAVRVVHVLNLYRPEGLAQTLVCDTPTIRPTRAPSDASIAYRVRFRIAPQIDAPAKVALPSISPADAVHPQTVSIACATSGAAIYYTTDDSHPAAGNAKATLYSVPFSVTSACAIRAIGYKSGMIASDSALSLIT